MVNAWREGGRKEGEVGTPEMRQAEQFLLGGEDSTSPNSTLNTGLSSTEKSSTCTFPSPTVAHSDDFDKAAPKVAGGEKPAVDFDVKTFRVIPKS